MPSLQGVLPWPPDGPNVVALAEEGELPFDDSSMDRVLLIHALESSEQVRPLLKEAWRVLGGAGRLLLFVPQPRGLLARPHRPPLGLGQPHTPSHLSAPLRDELVSP